MTGRTSPTNGCDVVDDSNNESDIVDDWKDVDDSNNESNVVDDWKNESN